MIKTAIKLLTPFIVSIVDIIGGVLLYLRCEGYSITPIYREVLSHFSGSSLLLILYVIVSSPHMCKYYKTSCWLLLTFHVMSLLYIFTDITTLFYIYITWVIMVASLVCWTISILSCKIYKTINQSCKRLETK